jgi:glycosyltransferase involved in cell wall biosynthesis
MNALPAFPIDLDPQEQIPCAPMLTKADGSPLSVMIDGFNLSLAKGTGVATYARNLSFCLRDLGCRVGVLYGGSAGRHHSPLLKEISFYDSQSLSLDRWQRFKKRVRSSIALNHNAAFEVPITGHVVPDTFSSRLPHYDTIWNATDLYLKASTQFDVFGVTNRVSMSKVPDISHWTYPLPIRTRGALNIYTLHDLVPLRLPYSTLDKKDRYLALIRWIARTADHIVTVSEASRRDLIEVAGIAPERVTNTYQAVTIPERYRLKPEAAVRGEIEGMFGLGFKNYYLFFGSIEPKKNVGRLIEAYLASGVEGPLVIVGAQSWKSEDELRPLAYQSLKQLIQSGSTSAAGRRVVQLEYVSLSLLVSLIRGAKAVLFPSLYEGFGLPVLESMLLGTPVLSSRTSSIPEVAGDAALLVNPYDTREIAEAIRTLDSNAPLRHELAAAGILQAALFSERAYSDRLSAVYQEVLARASGSTRTATARAVKESFR